MVKLVSPFQVKVKGASRICRANGYTGRVRQRITARMWKCLRRMRGEGRYLLSAVQRTGKNALTDSLCKVLVDPSLKQEVREAAARVLGIGDSGIASTVLMQHFFAVEERTELVEISKILQSTRAVAAVPHLIKALDDPNVHRREAAAYALGFPHAGTRAIETLSRVLTDSTQPTVVRGHAAESLHGSRKAVPSLIAALSDTAVEVRFWAVWSLGGQTIRESNSPIVPALEKLLADDSVYEGWWSIRREALAV